MRSSTTILTTISALASHATAATTIWATPHDSYSSSVGVLGCKINTDRVAYWPTAIGCDNICVKLSHGGRSVHLLRIDQSGGAHDVSYDAWNYLISGESATRDPQAGGPVEMTYEDVPAEECESLIDTDGHKLPLSASNSMNYLTSCLEQPGSWVGEHYQLFNVLDAICTWGFDEECELDYPSQNQATCGEHQLGLTAELTGAPVYDVKYPTGDTVIAGTGEVVAARAGAPAESKASPAVVVPTVSAPAATGVTKAEETEGTGILGTPAGVVVVLTSLIFQALQGSS